MSSSASPYVSRSSKRKFAKAGGTGLSSTTRSALLSALREKRRSRTQTMFAKKRKGRQIEVPGGESKSYFSWVNNKKPQLKGMLKESTAPQFVVGNSAVRLTSLTGKQEAYQTGIYFGQTDLDTMFTNVFGGSPNVTSKIVLGSVHSETIITNAENCNARIKIFDIVCKAGDFSTMTGPEVAFEAGGVDAGGGAAADYLIPGFHPTNVPRFTEFFKIEQETSIVLSPGATHIHNTHIAPNKVMSKLQTQYNNANVPFLTRFTMLLWYGTPVSAVSDPTEVSLSAINLNVVTTKSYRYKLVYYPFTNCDAVNSLDLALTGGGEVMNEDGVVQVETSA